MAQRQIAHLVPLNDNLEDLASDPRIPIFRGTNFVGRNTLPVPDKRLSRNHLTLAASPRSSATLFVEGTNPVVIRCGSERKKLYSRESGTIGNGDVIELIPGHYFFKYVVSDCDQNVGLSSHKRLRHTSPEDVRSEKFSKIVEEGKQRKSVVAESSGKSLYKAEDGDNDESIRRFTVSEVNVPRTFRLLKVQGLPQWANTSCVSIGDVVHVNFSPFSEGLLLIARFSLYSIAMGDILFAVLSNYMVDIDWLLTSCPAIKKIPQVLVLHGEGDGSFDQLKRRKPANWILHKPPLPISFGTHHSKAMLLVYPRGVRIIVHTANLIHVDWNNKSQALWMQDFPWKELPNSGKGSAFENDLVDYLGALKWPEFSVNFPNLGKFNVNSSFFRKFDYGNAEVRLIASVPGYHTGANLKKWGHMKLRTILQECTFDRAFRKSPLVYQFSSLGSLDEKWMAEFASSLSSGLSEDKTPLGPGQPLIIWPTVEQVRCSLEGYGAGNAIPSPLKNVEKAFLKKYWAKWNANSSGRSRVMPHIKTFARYSGQKLAWFLLTSSNLSKAAWGALQKNNSQLMIRSYELGVLFLPSKRGGSVFSCTANVSPRKDKCESSEISKAQRTELVTLNWRRNANEVSSSEVVKLPLPYEIPPQPYSSEDVPWSWDRRYTVKDVYGQVWPRHVQLYSNQDS